LEFRLIRLRLTKICEKLRKGGGGAVLATIEAGDRIFLREFKEGYEVLEMDYKHKVAIVRSHLAGVNRYVPFHQILSVKKKRIKETDINV